MSSATQLALSGSLLPVLLVGNQEEDFFLIREVLEQNQGAMPAELDHAGSIEEAKTMLQRGRYGLVLFEHDPEMPPRRNCWRSSCRPDELFLLSCSLTRRMRKQLPSLFKPVLRIAWRRPNSPEPTFCERSAAR